LPYVPTNASFFNYIACHFTALSHFLDGELSIEVYTVRGRIVATRLRYPPGSPKHPPTLDQLATKFNDCLRSAGLPDLDPEGWIRSGGAELFSHTSVATDFRPQWSGRDHKLREPPIEDLSKDETTIVEVVREFIDRDVKPVVRGLERSNTYPEVQIERMKALGVYGLAIPAPSADAHVSTPW
jgi:hypothetical protein